jgi:long-chain fatty acid transport protein
MKLKKLAVAAASFAVSAGAMATDGYFSHGYGMKAKGMGGAATAMASDAMGGANNPASMVFVGDRLDVGLDLFAPKRRIERSGAAANTVPNGAVDSGSNLFYVPEFGYNKMLGADRAIGITVYGNGGMNTDYTGGQSPAAGNACGTGAGQFNQASGQAGPYNMLCGAGGLGVNLEQLIIAPTFSIKLNKDNALGASVLIGYQKFSAKGISSFYGYTPSAALPYAANNFVTDKGNDSSTGLGLRFGWMGKMSETVTFGATYATKVNMKKFDKYKQLFAEDGDFDMPANLALGVAFKPAPAWQVAIDYQRIYYGDVNSVGNSSRMAGDGPAGTAGGIANSLGCASCRGFGWSDISVFKLGVEYQVNKDLVLRAGWNHTDNPIQARDVTFNILAPGVIRNHLTLGFTHAVSKDSELTMAYMHAFKNSVSGDSLFNKWIGGAAQDKIEMYQNSLGISYGLKF